MRLFLAFALPEALRRAAEAATRTLSLPARDWRAARGDGLHLTMRFLGEVDGSRMDELDAFFRQACTGTEALRLGLAEAGSFPRGPSPRIVWLGIQDLSPVAGLARLAERLELAARAAGLPAETKPFFPHVTIARARSGARPARPDSASVGRLGEFDAHGLTLFRSELGAAGSRYAVEREYPLDAGVVR